MLGKESEMTIKCKITGSAKPERQTLSATVYATEENVIYVLGSFQNIQIAHQYLSIGAEKTLEHRKKQAFSS
jgi:hypothetical protein